MEQTAMTNQTAATLNPCRSVTKDEIAHYQKHGWAKLDGFVDPAVVRHLLDVAKKRMGEDGDSNPAYGLNQPYFNAEYGGLYGDPEVRPMMEGIGRGAKALMNRKSGVGTRLFSDFFAPKLPSSKQTKNAGNGPTAFHQDYITFAVDRTGGMTFWIALEDYEPESGTMSFVSGSQAMGVMGSYHTYGGGDALDVYPELRDLPMSEPMRYRVGDVTVHTHLTIHGAGKNITDRPRWAYLVLVQPADVCWNGAPPEAFDTTGMTPNQLLDDPRFPVLA
jgi:hypothetical protein